MRKAAEILDAFAPKESLAAFHKFFLVGIGGAGMSALALMLKHRGFEVQGTDSTASSTTQFLTESGIDVQIGHSGQSITKDHAVILTDAIDLATSPEVETAGKLNLPLFRRSQALGWLLQKYRVIAVTGTHGKTTTTGMVGSALIEAGLDPLVVVGAMIPAWGSSVREGSGAFAVVEACEAYDSFHDIDPEVVVLTNLEPDHLDYHGTFENLQGSVARFVEKAGPTGKLVFCKDDAGARDLAQRVLVPKVGYQGYDFPGAPGLAGPHNLTNAAGALLAAKAVGADRERAQKGIAKFHGAERRMQVLYRDDITVIDDYAHHPTEIEMSLAGIREAHPGRLVVVYQPHLYSRTKDWIPEFASTLSAADLVVLTDIYPAREAPIPGISSARIAELITKPCKYVPSRRLLPFEVAKLVQPGDVVVGMGAGNISEFAPNFIKVWEDRPVKSGRRTRAVVLYGGDSTEREVSLHSGRAMHEALLRKGYQSRLLDVTDRLFAGGDLSDLTGAERPDVVLLAVHGSRAEDGAIQGLLELLHLPYSGSGIRASALAMDKDRTKEILKAAGLPVPRGLRVTSALNLPAFPAPAVVKPNAQGSTVGLSFVEHDNELKTAVEKALAYDSSALIEEWIVGTEISVPVLSDRALPPVEIVPNTGRYDFASKYVAGATTEICPARLSERHLETAKEYALRAHQTLGCSGATRTDMLIRGDEFFVIEVNTLPGMTATSLLPNSASASGMAFDDLVQWIAEDAMTGARA